MTPSAPIKPGAWAAAGCGCGDTSCDIEFTHEHLDDSAYPLGMPYLDYNPTTGNSDRMYPPATKSGAQDSTQRYRLYHISYIIHPMFICRGKWQGVLVCLLILLFVRGTDGRKMPMLPAQLDTIASILEDGPNV